MPGIKVLIKGLNKVIDFPSATKMADIEKHIKGNWSQVEEMSGLPMDKASRMERAKFMGFNPDQTVYHGTNANFSEFDPSRVGDRVTSLGSGHYLTPNRETAEGYGKNILEANIKGEGMLDWQNLNQEQRAVIENKLMEVVPDSRIAGFGKKKYEVIPDTAEGKSRLKELQDKTRENYHHDARAQTLTDDDIMKNYPGLIDDIGVTDDVVEWREGGSLEDASSQNLMTLMNEYRPELGRELGYNSSKFADQIAVYDPKNIRSVNAAFDPSKKDSANLLAGVGAAAVGVSAMSPEEAEAGALGKAGKSIAKEMKRLHPNIKSFITEDDGVVTLQKVIVDKESRGAGEGTKFMEDFLRLADEKGSKAALTPTSDFGGNKKRLEGFYERFGFTPNKGKAKDFSISESLVREPKALAAAGITALSTEQAQARQQAQKSFIESMLSDQSLESLPSFTTATAPGIDQMKLPQQYRADIGGFQAPGSAVPSAVHQAGGLLKKFDTPILGNPVEGVADYMINFGYDDSAKERAKRAASAGLDLI